MIQNKKQTTLKKRPYFKLTFQVSNYTTEEQKFLTIFNSQHSQTQTTTQHELAELLLKYFMVYATSKFDVGKENSPLKLDAVFKKQ